MWLKKALLMGIKVQAESLNSAPGEDPRNALVNALVLTQAPSAGCTLCSTIISTVVSLYIQYMVSYNAGSVLCTFSLQIGSKTQHGPVFLQAAEAFPQLYMTNAIPEDGAACTGPEGGFAAHLPPQPDAELTFMLMDLAGAPVTSFAPATNYTLMIAHSSLSFHAYVFVSSGMLLAPTHVYTWVSAVVPVLVRSCTRGIHSR